MNKVLLALMLAAPIASADPRQLSLHPRSGELAELSFSGGSARVSSDLAQKLGEIAGWAQDNPDGSLVIQRAAGDPALEQARAEAVRARLVALGVDEDRIEIAVPREAPTGKVVVVATREPFALPQ